MRAQARPADSIAKIDSTVHPTVPTSDIPMTGLHDISLPPDTNAKDFHCERLSAMMDGALSPDETRFLLRRMEHDDELADRWSRWQLIGDTMRGEAGRALPADFSHRVGRAIADDIATEQPLAVVNGDSLVARRPLLRWGGGAALAASVALAALIGTRTLPSQDGPATTIAATASIPVPGPSEPTPQPVSDAEHASPVAEAGAAMALASVVAATGERRGTHPRVLARADALASSAKAASPVAATLVTAATVRSQQMASRKHIGATEVASIQDSGIVVSEVGIVSKPWPRALVPGTSAAGGVVAGYETEISSAPHPFQRLKPRSAPLTPVFPIDDVASHAEGASASP